MQEDTDVSKHHQSKTSWAGIKVWFTLLKLLTDTYTARIPHKAKFSMVLIFHLPATRTNSKETAKATHSNKELFILPSLLLKNVSGERVSAYKGVCKWYSYLFPKINSPAGYHWHCERCGLGIETRHVECAETSAFQRWLGVGGCAITVHFYSVHHQHATKLLGTREWKNTLGLRDQFATGVTGTLPPRAQECNVRKCPASQGVIVLTLEFWEIRFLWG